MKFLLTIIVITFLSLHLFGQEAGLPQVATGRTNNYLLYRYLHWNWDNQTQDWMLEDSTNYTFDDQENVATEVISRADSMQNLVPLQQTVYSYNEDNLVTQELLQSWDNNAWINSSQTVYTYDQNLDQVGILFQNWNDSIWSNAFQQLFTYDNQHNALTRTSQVWLGTDWSNGTRQVNTYDVANHLVQRLFQNYNAGWTDVSRSLYTYDANGDLDTLLYQKWFFNDWNDDYRNLYDFDDHHNRVLILEQLALALNMWEDQDKYEYTYDQFDQITHLLNSHYTNNAWTNVYQYNLANDIHHNRVTEVYQTWNANWENGDSTQYYYLTFGETAVQDLNEPAFISILPNPTRDLILIEWSDESNARIGIYSSDGARVRDFSVGKASSIQINVSSLPAGLYWITLQQGHHLTTKAFEKQ